LQKNDEADSLPAVRMNNGDTAKTTIKVGVIALVPDAWKSVWMPRHQILSRLAGSFDVVWIDPAEDWREHWLLGRPRFAEAQRFTEIAPAFSVMTSGRRWPEVIRPAWLRTRLTKGRLRAARSYLFQRGAKQIVLYLWRPEFAPAIDLVEHDASCYHIDDEYGFSDVELPNPGQETELIRTVNQVIVHSRRLMEKKGAINPNTALVPNGVDYEAFANPRAEPPDLACVSRPRIGYVGVIKKQLDLGLLLRLARARGDWNFIMVGPIGTVTGKEQALTGLQTLPNVHFLGEKPVDALSAYTQHMDVCLMCYEANDYTKYIYPLKLHEYLASGRPAVATPIDSVVEHGDLVALARTDSEWIAAIEQALLQQGEMQRRTRQDRARAYDWNKLAARVAALILQRVAPAADLGRKHNRGG
jgi:glycosyltransferase involved in cell wall biosynthesis